MGFFPIDQVDEGFFAVMEEIGEALLKIQPTDDISDKVEVFVCYFEETSIIGKKLPMIEPLIWSQSKAAAEGLVRNKNCCRRMALWHSITLHRKPSQRLNLYTTFQARRRPTQV